MTLIHLLNNIFCTLNGKFLDHYQESFHLHDDTLKTTIH